MGKRICGFVGNPPLRDGAFSRITSEGARLVINEFFYNMMLYADFDEYHFFCTDPTYAEGVVACNNIKLFQRKDYETQIRKEEYEIIYANLNPDVLDLAKIRDAHKKTFKIFSFIHSQHFIEHFWLCHQYAYVCRPDDVLLSSSQTGREVLKSFFSCFQVHDEKLAFPRVEVVPFGVDVEHLKIFDREAVRSEVSVVKDAKILLSLGRFSFWDKVDLIPVLHMFERLLMECEKAVLVLAGADPGLGHVELLRRYIEEYQLGGNILLFTNLSEELKQKLYSCADVFVSFSDSIQETFGLTIHEAQRYGLPVVCSDWNGYKELVEEGINGFKIATYWDQFDFFVQNEESEHLQKLVLQKNSVVVDVEDAVEKLVLMVKDEALRARMGTINSQKIIKSFSWKTIIGRHLDLLFDLQQSTGAISLVAAASESFGKCDFNYYEHFRCYPTRNALFESSPLRFKVCRDIDIRDFVANYYGKEQALIGDVLNVDILAKLIVLFKGGREFESDSLLKECACDEKVVRYCILWLLKQGFLAVDKVIE